jgi:hypothetical protein
MNIKPTPPAMKLPACESTSASAPGLRTFFITAEKGLPAGTDFAILLLSRIIVA